MLSPSRTRHLLAVAMLGGIALSGCGGDDSAERERLEQDKIEAAREEGAREARADARLREQAREQRRLRQEIERLKRDGRGSAASSAPAASSPAPSRSEKNFRACDKNIETTPTATCAFASNVFYEYHQSGRASSVTAWSPSTRSFVTLSCAVNAATVVCDSSRGSTTRFSVTSVDLYSDAAARRYAASAEVGP